MAYFLNSLFALLIFTLPLGAQSFFDGLYSPAVDDVVDLVLTLPVDSIIARTRNEQAGIVSFTGQDGQPRQFSADVSLRGRFRQVRCTFPPLRLNLSKKELKAAGLLAHDKYKLVTTCYEDSTATALLLKEYLAYQAYALLSPQAYYRTQLLRITYRDAAGHHPDRTNYAFLIEDTDEMAERLGGKELDDAIGLAAERYEVTAEATQAMFQYFIGNGDWSLPLQRNVKIVARPDGMLVPVAYDFDFSGWVGAPYASPSRDHGQQSIYHRVYLGYHQSDRTLRQVNQDFRSKRRELVALISDFDLISKNERTVLLRFVQRFYNDLGEISRNTTTLFYTQLRGDTASVIPPGAEPRAYRSARR